MGFLAGILNMAITGLLVSRVSTWALRESPGNNVLRGGAHMVKWPEAINLVLKMDLLIKKKLLKLCKFRVTEFSG